MMKNKVTFDCSFLKKPKVNVTNSSIKDPFHYTSATIKSLKNLNIGFEVKPIHEYGHPFQKLVEFYCPK